MKRSVGYPACSQSWLIDVGAEILIELGLIAIIIEALVGAFKTKNKWEWITMGAGALLCPLIQADLFTSLGLPLSVPRMVWLGPLLGRVFTGVIVSRGADYLMALWGRVNGYHAEAQMKGADKNDNGNGKPTVV